MSFRATYARTGWGLLHTYAKRAEVKAKAQSASPTPSDGSPRLVATAKYNAGRQQLSIVGACGVVKGLQVARIAGVLRAVFPMYQRL